MLKNNRKFFLYTLLICLTQICSETHSIVVKEINAAGVIVNQVTDKCVTAVGQAGQDGIMASTQFGSDAAGKVAAVGDKFAVISGAAVCVVAVVQTASLAKDIASAVFPSNEQKARELEYSLKYNYLLKKKELKDCLVKNAYHKKGPSGLPSVCEETAEMFALAAGDDEEFNKLVNVFKNIIRNE
jgi:hypothetical protein